MNRFHTCFQFQVALLRQGDWEAQYAQGYQLLCEENEAAGGETEYRSPRAQVGLAVCIHASQFPVAHKTETRSCGFMKLPSVMIYLWVRPWAGEGVALLEKAAAQGHAYAMDRLGIIHLEREMYERAVEWFTKAAKVERCMLNSIEAADESAWFQSSNLKSDNPL